MNSEEVNRRLSEAAIEIEEAARQLALLGSVSYEEAVDGIRKAIASFGAANLGEIDLVGKLNLSVDSLGRVSITQKAHVPGSMEAVPLKARSRKHAKFLKEIRRL